MSTPKWKIAAIIGLTAAGAYIGYRRRPSNATMAVGALTASALTTALWLKSLAGCGETLMHLEVSASRYQHSETLRTIAKKAEQDMGENNLVAGAAVLAALAACSSRLPTSIRLAFITAGITAAAFAAEDNASAANLARDFRKQGA